MKIHKLLIALTIANLALLVFLLARTTPVAAEDIAPVLRGRALEVVDGQGRVRATLGILAAEPASGDRAAYPETVILRLMNSRGRPAVKISTSDEGSGLMLTGSADTHETYVTMGGSGVGTQIKLRNEDGRQQLLKP